jgi:peroxiredoxin Q/BCP
MIVIGMTCGVTAPFGPVVNSTTAVARSLCAVRRWNGAAVAAARQIRMTALLAQKYLLRYKFKGFTMREAMEVNDKAPDFALSDEEGKTLSLKDYRGKSVVLFFYPKANTSGCTAEACGFRDSYDRISKTGAVVLGISPDKPRAQKKFKDEFGFPFPLLCDEGKAVAKDFGVLKEKSMYGKKYMGIERTTFVIGPDGTINAVISGIKADEHPAAALAALKG